MMPNYDYQCDRCGAFTAMRPMAESDLPGICPGCGSSAPRAYLTAPYFAMMSVERRTAYATNERSAAAPQSLSGMTRRHRSACTCCSGSSLRRDKGARKQPVKRSGSRPWMISH